MATEKVLATQVRGAFVVAVTAAQAAGVDTREWVLGEGSQVYGRSWRLVRRDPKAGGERDICRLGWTRREAWFALHGLATAFELTTLNAR